MPTPQLDLDGAVRRARCLATPGIRRLLGVAGPPGAGKSTLAARLAAELGPSLSVVVPMDGFHLAQAQLDRLGRADRKGAPDTFDADGYAALLRRLSGQRLGDGSVWAPAFDRDLEEPIAGSIEVRPDVPLVITEGNYLLGDGPWRAAAAELEECWYVEIEDAARLKRLVARHVRHGRSPRVARDWAAGPDEANARLITATAERAQFRVLVR